MASPWPAGAVGVVTLPSGRRVRGRGLRADATDAGGVEPSFGLYLLGRPPPPTPWPQRWLPWPDFRLPRDRADAVAAYREALDRAATERVELACGGGRGRTGTALACLAVLDGVVPDQAVAWVRSQYRPNAVETPWQRRYVQRFRG
ncbi:protein-tyrosine phosphatase family protein [Jatrophihabitans sp. YIM 134969]